MFKHILIPTDGSELSRRAVLAGVRLARALGAKVTGLFAAPAATPIVYRDLLPVGYGTPQQNAVLIKRAARHHLDVVARAAKAAGVRCETVSVIDDYPADAILMQAKKRRCDLLFNPDVREDNVLHFWNLIQLDGFNPLVLNETRFAVSDREGAAATLNAFMEPEQVAAISPICMPT